MESPAQGPQLRREHVFTLLQERVPQVAEDELLVVPRAAQVRAILGDAGPLPAMRLPAMLHPAAARPNEGMIMEGLAPRHVSRDGSRVESDVEVPVAGQAGRCPKALGVVAPAVQLVIVGPVVKITVGIGREFLRATAHLPTRVQSPPGLLNGACDVPLDPVVGPRGFAARGCDTPIAGEEELAEVLGDVVPAGALLPTAPDFVELEA
mmetsp:Transcript_22406/g.38129  ORF Transcript_22406/g.38129 Transcript_22406/m.38129 type:complete len:208 (-) Transcript_22406:352-975(-)